MPRCLQVCVWFLYISITWIKWDFTILYWYIACFFCPEPEPAPARKRRGKQRMTTERKVQTSLIRGVSVKYMVMSMIYIIMSMLLIMSWVFMCCLYRGWWRWGSPPHLPSRTWPKTQRVRSKSRDYCPWSWPGKISHAALPRFWKKGYT